MLSIQSNKSNKRIRNAEDDQRDELVAMAVKTLTEIQERESSLSKRARIGNEGSVAAAKDDLTSFEEAAEDESLQNGPNGPEGFDKVVLNEFTAWAMQQTPDRGIERFPQCLKEVSIWATDLGSFAAGLGDPAFPLDPMAWAVLVSALLSMASREYYDDQLPKTLEQSPPTRMYHVERHVRALVEKYLLKGAKAHAVVTPKTFRVITAAAQRLPNHLPSAAFPWDDLADLYSKSSFDGERLKETIRNYVAENSRALPDVAEFVGFIALNNVHADEVPPKPTDEQEAIESVQEAIEPLADEINTLQQSSDLARISTGLADAQQMLHEARSRLALAVHTQGQKRLVCAKWTSTFILTLLDTVNKVQGHGRMLMTPREAGRMLDLYVQSL